MRACDVIKNKLPSTSLIEKDSRYIKYLIISSIANKKATRELIAKHITLNIGDNSFVDEEALSFYLNINFDSNGKEEYILSKQEEDLYRLFHRLIKAINENSDASNEKLISKIMEKMDTNYEEALAYNYLYFKNNYNEKFSDLYLRSLYFDLLINYNNYKTQFENIRAKFNIIDKKEMFENLDDDIVENPLLSMLVTYSNTFEKKWLKRFDIVTLKDLLNNNYKLFSLIFCIEVNSYLRLLNDINAEKIKKIFIRFENFYDELDDKWVFIYNSRTKRVGTDRVLTLQEVGDEIGLTRERVRQIEAKIHKKINYIKINFDDLIPVFRYVDIKRLLYVSNERFIKILNNEIVSKLIKIKTSNSNNMKIHFSEDYDTFYFEEKNIDEIVDEFKKTLPSVIIEENYKKTTYIEKMIIDNDYKLTKKGFYIKKQYNESDTYLELLDLYFPEGYRINNDDDYNFLMDKYKELYKTEEVPTSSRYIATKLDSNKDYCIIDRGMYLRRDKCPELPNQLKNKIINYIKNSNLVVYYSEIYELFKFELNMNNINNQYLLKGLLDHELGSEFHRNRDFITYGTQQNKWVAIINYMKSFNNIFTLDDLYNEFQGVSYTIFQGIISSESDKGLLILYNKRFIYVNKTNIAAIKSELKNKIEELFITLNTNYLTSHKIYAKIALSNNNFLSKVNFEVDGFNLYSIIRSLFPNDYYYRRPIISKLDAGIITNIIALRQYLITLDEFDIKKVEMYVTKMGLSNKWFYEYYTLCEYMSEEFVLIDKKTMVKKEKLDIDEYTLNQIESNLDILLERYDEINLNEFDAYFVFPDIKGYEWNKYLLIGLINTYMLDKYEMKKDSINFCIRRINNEL